MAPSSNLCWPPCCSTGWPISPPRLGGVDADIRVQRALHDVGVGLSVVGLNRDSATLLPGARDSIAETLAAVAAHYRQPEPEPPAPALLTHIDCSIAVVARTDAALARQPLMELLAIRQGLFPDAPAPNANRADPAGAVR